jgi:hypothetical protein
MEQGKGSCLCGPLGLARADEREQKMAAADIAFLDAVAAREEVVALRTKMKALHKSLQMASVSAWHLDDAATLGARADGVELALGLFEERSNG